MSAKQLARTARARWRNLRSSASQEWCKRRLIRQGHDVLESAFVDPSATFATQVTLGRGSRINSGVTIKGGGPVTIGAFCDVSEGSTIITSNHRVDTPSMEFDLARKFGWQIPRGPQLPAVIGASAWLGERCIVLPGVQIGEGAICAAGAVVTRDVEPFATVAGVPARVVGSRFTPEVIALLLDVRWWAWDDHRLSRNRAFFEADLTQLSAAQVAALIQD